MRVDLQRDRLASECLERRDLHCDRLYVSVLNGAKVEGQPLVVSLRSYTIIFELLSSENQALVRIRSMVACLGSSPMVLKASTTQGGCLAHRVSTEDKMSTPSDVVIQDWSFAGERLERRQVDSFWCLIRGNNTQGWVSSTYEKARCTNLATQEMHRELLLNGVIRSRPSSSWRLVWICGYGGNDVFSSTILLIIKSLVCLVGGSGSGGLASEGHNNEDLRGVQVKASDYIIIIEKDSFIWAETQQFKTECRFYNTMEWCWTEPG